MIKLKPLIDYIGLQEFKTYFKETPFMVTTEYEAVSDLFSWDDVSEYMNSYSRIPAMSRVPDIHVFLPKNRMIIARRLKKPLSKIDFWRYWKLNYGMCLPAISNVNRPLYTQVREFEQLYKSKCQIDAYIYGDKESSVRMAHILTGDMFFSVSSGLIDVTIFEEKWDRSDVDGLNVQDVFTVGPNDILYIPAGHYIKMKPLERTLALGIINDHKGRQFKREPFYEY